ncbi:hypothetical protein HY991_03655 [Candidatus Micrarchaeota archaeon]|nr:hypothetical protein [Candidatus Micrarchaeota archaeon]
MVSMPSKARSQPLHESVAEKMIKGGGKLTSQMGVSPTLELNFYFPSSKLREKTLRELRRIRGAARERVFFDPLGETSISIRRELEKKVQPQQAMVPIVSTRRDFLAAVKKHYSSATKKE